MRTIKDLPKTPTAILDCCPKPPSKPESPAYPTYGRFPEKDIPIVVQLKDFTWLLGRTLMRTFRELNAEEVQRERDERNRNVTLSAQFFFQFGQDITPLFATPCQLYESAASLLLQRQPTNGIGVRAPSDLGGR